MKTFAAFVSFVFLAQAFVGAQQEGQRFADADSGVSVTIPEGWVLRKAEFQFGVPGTIVEFQKEKIVFGHLCIDATTSQPKACLERLTKTIRQAFGKVEGVGESQTDEGIFRTDLRAIQETSVERYSLVAFSLNQKVYYLVITASEGEWQGLSETVERIIRSYGRGTKGTEKEVPVTPKKDPLAYRVHRFDGGTIALFDHWKITAAGAKGQRVELSMSPNGRESDFAIWVFIGIANPKELENLFVEGPRLVTQYFQGYRRVGDQAKCTFGGDEARVELYEGSAQGKKVMVQVVYMKKKDVGVIVLCNGTESAYSEFGRSVEIVAQSLSFQESPLEAALIGTWVWESNASGGDIMVVSRRIITIFPNGGFTESSEGATAVNSPSTPSTPSDSGPGIQDSHLAITSGKGRGMLVKRGSLLTFHYDDGKTSTSSYSMKGSSGLVLNGVLFIKQ